MRAAVFHGRGDIRIEDRPAPRPAADELLIRVSVTGVCGTDAAELATGPHLYWIGPPHPASGHAGPLIPGHELVGRVEALGRDVDGFRIGELVVSGAGVSCGSCRSCRLGRTNLCDRYWTVGLQRDGGLAELVAVPAAICRSVEPYGLTEDAAALAQPMAIAAHAVDRGEPRDGEDVLVVGAGGIGGFIVFAAASAGGSVIAYERDADRRRIAASFGARVIEPPVGGPMAGPSATEGPGTEVAEADLVFEVTGSRAGLDLAMASVRRGGRLVVVGLQDPPSALDLRSLALREIELIGTVAHRCARDLPAALRLLADRRDGWSDVAPVAIPLEALVADGLQPISNGTSQRIKTLVDPRILTARPTVMGDIVGAAS
jgi:(R,R)-butanediol dehydrogenase/meso-butanediol dehydrogenase/diacetyl reductase